MRQSALPSVPVTEPALPKGGGSMRGFGETLGQAGPTGMATMSLPLPISPGRGFAPSLALNYASGVGNGPFGTGWGLSVASIQRRTSRGVPLYDDSDEFIGPDGEVLVPERTADGQIVSSSVDTYQTVKLDDIYSVTRYFPRTEGNFARVERWVGSSTPGDFWLVHERSGTLHCFGKTTAAQVADPATLAHIAEWLLDESLSVTGEHICFQYLPEDGKNVDVSGNEGRRDSLAYRYLSRVDYGNVTPCAALFVFGATPPSSQTWLFSTIFDYGQRSVDSDIPPAFDTTNDWPARQDPFSRYSYGFELRCHRLCRQVLMFHHFAVELGAPDTLVARLLLEYAEDPVMTQMTGARQLAYEPDGTLQQLPPLDIAYTPFNPVLSADHWQSFDAFPGLNDNYPYQFVDLYGEGIPGMLCRMGAWWYYRPAIRQANAAPDGVAYAAGWTALPSVPALQPLQSRLMDMDGDGKLDWLVTQPGIAGYFSLGPDGKWSGFMPFGALPTEFFHPQAEFADLVGAGLSDLALIGPKSVRFYANQREAGFAAGVDVKRDDDDLPVMGRDARELVAFSDILGSGETHLVRIRADSVTVWPNLGRGHFAHSFPFAELGFDAVSFDPERVYLADLDGSGAADLLYLERDHLQIYLNQSGNGFAEPIVLPLPEEVKFDRLCQLSLADLQGQGMATLILTVPYLTTRHWRYDFATAKPYLLDVVDNNMGLSTSLTYRSSAQEWLDEKTESASPVSHLPFPIHLVSKRTSTDQITGNILGQSFLYRKGVYDGVEQEFRGFGFVQGTDISEDSDATDSNISHAVPLTSRSWYHTGNREDEDQLHAPCWKDEDAYTVGPTRLTQFDSDTGKDVVLTDQDSKTSWWLYRALKGSLLRTETYGSDDSAGTPYGVISHRYQVRQVQPAFENSAPVVMPWQLEQATYVYERVASDPLVSQQVALQCDKYGARTWSVDIAYPRRPQGSNCPYPATLPATTWSSSYDSQQQYLRLSEHRASVWNLTDPQQWRLGLPDAQRGNSLTYDATTVPVGGLNYENLTAADSGLLDDQRPRTYGGQNEVVYRDPASDGVPNFLALVDHQETAELDSVSLSAYDGILDRDTLTTMLGTAGYQSKPTVLSCSGTTEDDVWVIAAGYATYADSSGFYRPITTRRSTLSGAATLTYDSYYCAVTAVEDARVNTSTADYDYRFLTPKKLVDVNGNAYEAQLDALGRVIASTFYGTENSVEIGFASIAKNPPSAGQTVEALIDQAGTSVQQLAVLNGFDPFAWMGQISKKDFRGKNAKLYWDQLLKNRLITLQGHIRAAGRRWLRDGGAYACPESIQQAFANASQMPVNSVALTADRYPGDADQQVRVNVAYADGFGRALQSCVKVPAGAAWQRTADGEIAVDPNGVPEEAQATTRWAVTGRIEYDNKGQPVRSYQPYFVDDWKYVADKAMRTCGYADTHYYDATGREVRVETAKGYERLTSFYPWFVVSEDENDTAGNAPDSFGQIV